MQVAGKTYSSDTRQRRGHGVREGGLSQQAQRKERRSSRQGPLRRPHGKQQASSLSVFHKAHPAFFSPSEPFPRWRPPRTCLPKGWTKTSLSVSKRLGGRNANAQTEPLGRSCRPLWRPSLAQEWLGQGWSPRLRVLRGFGKCYSASQRLTGSSGQPGERCTGLRRAAAIPRSGSRPGRKQADPRAVGVAASYPGPNLRTSLRQCLCPGGEQRRPIDGCARRAEPLIAITRQDSLFILGAGRQMP